LRFRDAKGTTVLAFDLDQALVLDVGQGRRACVRPIAAGLRKFFEEQLVRAGVTFN
jgi:hypothetical protein